MVDDVPETDAVGVGRSENLRNGGLSNTSSGIVDDALEGLFIVGIHSQTEVCEDVFDFLALIERQTAVDAVWHGLFAKGVLEDTALGIGAIEDGKVGILAAFSALDGTNGIGHHLGLFNVGVGVEHMELFTSGIFGEHVLLDLPAVLLDETISSLDDVLCGAIVLLQFEEPCSVVYLLEGEYVVNICSTETINALRIIAYDTDVMVLTSELPHDAVLRKVGVLILIYQHITETLLPLGKHIGMLLKEEIGVEENVVEVHSITLTTAVSVSLKDLS